MTKPVTDRAVCGFCLTNVALRQGRMRNHLDDNQQCRASNLTPVEAHELFDRTMRGAVKRHTHLRLPAVPATPDHAGSAVKHVHAVIDTLGVERINQERKQSEVADTAGCFSGGSLSGWEAHVKTPKFEALVAWADTLNHDIQFESCEHTFTVTSTRQTVKILREAREREGLGRETMRDQRGVNDRSLGAWETHTKQPQTTWLTGWAIALGYSLVARRRTSDTGAPRP